MSGLSDTTVQVLQQIADQSPDDAFVTLTRALNHPPTAPSALEQVVLLHELFRRSIATRQPDHAAPYLTTALRLVADDQLPVPSLLGYFQCTVATYLEYTGHALQAEELYYRALNTDLGQPADSLLPPNTLTPRWIALINLGRLLLQRLQSTTAATYLATAVSEIQAYYPHPIEELIDLLCDLGKAHRRQGALDQALRDITQAYDIARHLHGDPHPVTAELAERVGQVTLQQNLPHHAHMFFHRAAQMYRVLDEPPRLIRCLANLAAVAYIQHDYGSAYTHGTEALALSTRHGTAHSVRLGLAWNLALTSAELTRFPQALAYCSTVRTLLHTDPHSNPERRDAYLDQLQVLEATCRARRRPSETSPGSVDELY